MGWSGAQDPHAVRKQAPRWVVFDAVGTLIFPSKPVADVYRSIGSRHGSRRTSEQISQSFRQALEHDDRADMVGCSQGVWQCRPTSEARERERWRAIVAHVIDDVTSDACFEELFEYFGRIEAWRCFDDVQACLDRLSHLGISVAVASNFDSRLDTICSALPPLRDLSPVLVSSRIGFRKPDVRFFEAMLTAIDCGPDDVLFVGDDLRNDIEAARSAGIQAVRIDRSAAGSQDEVVTDLGEIVPWCTAPGEAQNDIS